jgi:heterodisulfide reductase subunit B
MKPSRNRLSHVLLKGAVVYALAMQGASAQAQSASPPAAPAPVTAIDIVLEPDATMLRHAEANNARLLKVYPKGFALDAAHRPHITMIQRFVRTADLEKVYAAAEKVLVRANVTGMRLEAFKYYYAPGKDVGVAGIVARPTPALLKLQRELVAAVAPFTAETGTMAAFVSAHDDPALDAILIGYVSTFVPKYSGERFNPHVSTGRCRAAAQYLGASHRPAGAQQAAAIAPPPADGGVGAVGLSTLRISGAPSRNQAPLDRAPLARMERRTPPLSRPVRWRKAANGTLPLSVGHAALLTGCIMDVAFGEVHGATVHVLRAHGVESLEVPAQECCGALHLHAGEVESAQTLARRNIAAFEAAGDAPIVVNSAGCGAAMKGYGALLASDPAWAERAHRFASRVRDVSEYIASLPRREPPQSVPLTVAYDDPCHLAHAQKLREPPRELLSRIPGLKLVPLREADMCCGSAGSYSLLEPAMSAQVLRRKMEHIAASGAEVIATGNPGCLMQLRLGARDCGMAVHVVHPIELLAAGFGWRAPGA